MKFERLFGVCTVVALLGFMGCSPSEQAGSGESGQEVAASDDGSTTESTASEMESGEEELKDIVDTAVAAGDFGTLAAALTAGELIDTLKSDGPFTVFAPTDEAFAKLPEGTVENLLKPENKDQLVAVLTYHVVPGKVDSTAVSSLKNAKTVNGAEIAIDASADGVKINDASVTVADIVCSNGIIHVIDSVILPPSE
jgi:uncharacterized surface protein with fasciclin (FAS1) repeats